MELELHADVKNHASFYLVDPKDTFQSLLDKLVKCLRVPIKKVPCVHLLGGECLILTDNEAKESEGMLMLPPIKMPNTFFVLTACSTSNPSLKDDKNALSNLMKAQNARKKMTNLCSFAKKTQEGHNK